MPAFTASTGIAFTGDTVASIATRSPFQVACVQGDGIVAELAASATVGHGGGCVVGARLRVSCAACCPTAEAAKDRAAAMARIASCAGVALVIGAVAAIASSSAREIRLCERDGIVADLRA